MTLQDTLDWPFRLALFSGYAARQGCSLERTGDSDDVVRRLHEAVSHTAWQGRQLSLDFMLGPNSPVLKLAGGMTAELGQRGQSWRNLVDRVERRRQFCEVDVKLGRLGPKGLFGILENSGLMGGHRVVQPRDVDDACANPPGPGTRAHIRGKAIRELASQAKHAQCDWRQIWDPERNRILDLGDPFECQEVWVGSPGEVEEEFPSPSAGARLRAVIEALRGAR
jgi:hypothetical protein